MMGKMFSILGSAQVNGGRSNSARVMARAACALAIVITILLVCFPRGGITTSLTAVTDVEEGKGIPPESLRLAVEFSDHRLLSNHAAVACQAWINDFPHAVIYSDSFSRENLPLDSPAASECAPHIEFASITAMTVDSRGEQQHLGGSIDLAQLKREVIVKDMARRLEAEELSLPGTKDPERLLGRADWVLLTEEDTWWNQQKLYRFLHTVERDISFDRSTMPLLHPTLAGAGYVETDSDDIVYGPMMIMSATLVSQVAMRLDTCRIRAAHHCLEHQVLDICTGGCGSGRRGSTGRSEGTTAPLALEHPNPNLPSVFIPEFALKMAYRNNSEKVVRNLRYLSGCFSFSSDTPSSR